VIASSSEPNETNGYLAAHVNRLLRACAIGPAEIFSTSIRLLWIKRASCFMRRLWSYRTTQTSDPILNYANLVGFAPFELSWDELICLPSRRTAEPVDQDERARLLEAGDAVRDISTTTGAFGVPKTGRRFLIEQATVWNLFDESGVTCGQAADV